MDIHQLHAFRDELEKLALYIGPFRIGKRRRQFSGDPDEILFEEVLKPGTKLSPEMKRRDAYARSLRKEAELPEVYYQPNEYDNRHALLGIAHRHGPEAAQRVARAHRDRDTLLKMNLMKIHGGAAPETPHKALLDSASWDKAVTDRAIDGLPSFTPEEVAGLRKTLEDKRQSYADKRDKASFLTRWYHKGNEKGFRNMLDTMK